MRKLTSTLTTPILAGVVFLLLALLLPFEIANAQGSVGVDTVRNALGEIPGSGPAHFVYLFVVSILGWIAFMMASVMDFVLMEMVFKYGELYLQSFGGAVEIGWATIRDLMNVAFIFGLVYIGLRFILFSDDGAAKRNLALLIIAALLVNFSLFFAKAIVDVSHALIYQFNETASFIVIDEAGTERTGSLSGAIISTFAVSSVIGMQPDSWSNTSGWIMVALITITLLLLSFIFIAIAVILLIRTVVITFLLIFSPIMFIGWVFPALSSMSRQWLRTFLSQAFLAPLLFLFVYLSLMITNEIFQADIIGPDAQFSDRNYQVYSGFVLGITFLIISLIAAQKLGSGAAGASVQMLDNGRRRLQTRTANMVKTGGQTGVRIATAPFRAGANALGRKFVGGAGKQLENLNNWSERSAGGRAVKAIAFSTFGFNERSRQQAFTAMQNRKFGGYSYQDNKDFKEKQQVKHNELENEEERSNARANAEKILDSAESTTEDIIKALSSLADTIKYMSDTELAKAGLKTLKDPKIAVNLTDRQIEGLEKSGKYSNDQIREIKQARKTGQINIAQTGISLEQEKAKKLTAAIDNNVVKAQRERLMSQSVSDAGKLPNEVFREPSMYAYITPRIMEEKIRTGDIKDEDMKKIKEALLKHLGISSFDELNNDSKKNNQWAKWMNSNSSYAAQFFNN